jgi:hypothetical protein
VTRPRAIAKLIMMTSIAATGSRQAPGADWSGTLDAALNAAYVTNPQWIVGSHVTDQFAQLTVDGKTTAQSELGLLTVTPRFSSLRYRHDTSLDIDTGSVDVAYQQKTERGGQWTFAGQALTDSTVTSELGTTGLTETNRRHYANSLSLGYTYYFTERLSWLLQGAWQDARYTDAQQFGLTNYTYASALVSPTWSLSDRMQTSLLLSAGRLTPDVGFRQDNYSASLQLSRNVTEKYSWRASAGASRVDAGSAGTSTSPVYELAGSRQTQRVQLDLSVKRAVLPIGLGFLAPQTAATFSLAVATTEHSALTVSLAGLRTDEVKYGNLLLYSGATWAQGTADWRYTFSPHWTVSAAYRQGRARNLVESAWANSNEARINVSWQSGRL